MSLQMHLEDYDTVATFRMYETISGQHLRRNEVKDDCPFRHTLDSGMPIYSSQCHFHGLSSLWY